MDERAALEETAEILADEDTLEAIRHGLEDIAAHDVVTLEQARGEFSRRATS